MTVGCDKDEHKLQCELLWCLYNALALCSLDMPKTLALLSHSLSRTLLLQTSTAGSTDNMSVGPDLLSSGTAVVLFECAGE